jgi:hypothetical protein
MQGALCLVLEEDIAVMFSLSANAHQEVTSNVTKGEARYLVGSKAGV